MCIPVLTIEVRKIFLYEPVFADEREIPPDFIAAIITLIDRSDNRMAVVFPCFH